MSFVQVRNLNRIYRGVDGQQADQVVFRNFSLDIENGKTTAVIGPSGCGKSTLLHVIGGLESPRQRRVEVFREGGENRHVVVAEGEGRVTVDGFAMSEATADERADFISRSLGFVFQFHHLIPELSALENVMLPLQIQNVAASEAKSRAVGWLAKVGLAGQPGVPDKSERLPGLLSGGERQRVAIARALVNRPRLLLADEPTGSLDPERKEEVFALLRSLASDEGTTVVLVTHDVALLKDEGQRPLVDRVVSLKHGNETTDAAGWKEAS